MVFVIDKDGKPLMPTKRHRKVRLWLKMGQAKIVRRTPFTIQLLFETGSIVQELTIGVDPGYKTIGISVVSDTEEVFSAEIELRTDVSEKVKERKMYRQNRRSRKTRYRKPRFLNRKKGQRLAPSIHQKVESHLRVVHLLQEISPIQRIIVESNSFDPHKLKNPVVHGTDYQQGAQFGFENVRAYVLTRDEHQCYFKKPCSKKLHVHHIVFRSQGGSDAPSNLVTLCEKHHQQVHAGKIKVNAILHKPLKSATAMNIVRSQILQKLPDAQETFGYITKAIRQQQGLEKTHSTDAFVIAGGESQKRCNSLLLFFKRKNNRSLQLNRIGFKPSIRRRRYAIQPQDLVRYADRIYRAVGIQNKGTYLKMTDGSKPLVKRVDHVHVIYHQKTLIAA